MSKRVLFLTFLLGFTEPSLYGWDVLELSSKYSGEYDTWPTMPKLESEHPNFKYREVYGFSPIHNRASELAYQFIYVPSFKNGILGLVEVLDSSIALMTIEERGKGIGVCDESIECIDFVDELQSVNLELTNGELNSFIELLGEIEFENHPPGRYYDTSLDGDLMLIEEKKGDRYRFWATKDAENKDVRLLIDYFTSYADRKLITSSSTRTAQKARDL